MKTTIIFDTETTGLIKPDANDLDDQPYITELFAVKFVDGVDFSLMEKLHLMIKPPVPLSAEITRITGITNDFIANCPSFLQCFKEIAEFWHGSERMVAHNCAFDASMLANELHRHDLVLKFPWPMEHYCTVERSMHIEGRRLTLTKLHEYATGQAEIMGAHRAGNDVQALVKCYQWLLKEGYND